MTEKNGRAGSQKTRRQIAVQLSRIQTGQSTAWRGKTIEGNLEVHVGYHQGRVSVEVCQPSRSIPGGRAWRLVAQFRPALVEAEASITTGGDSFSRRLIAQQQITGEMRKANRTEMGRLARQAELLGLGVSDPARETLVEVTPPSGLVIRESQLARWFDLRNAHLDRLSSEANQGSVEIQVWFS